MLLDSGKICCEGDCPIGFYTSTIYVLLLVIIVSPYMWMSLLLQLWVLSIVKSICLVCRWGKQTVNLISVTWHYNRC